jgi:hypothetical protein
MIRGAVSALAELHPSFGPGNDPIPQLWCYYRHYCYLALYCFCGNIPLLAQLRVL